jgi:predicted alpha/beta hydrolase
MVDAVAARAPGKPLTWIGHSLGGQLLGLLPDRARIAKAVAIAAGSGYWRDNSPGLRWRVWGLWGLLVPVTVPLFGYFPGKRLRVEETQGPQGRARVSSRRRSAASARQPFRSLASSLRDGPLYRPSQGRAPWPLEG